MKTTHKVKFSHFLPRSLLLETSKETVLLKQSLVVETSYSTTLTRRMATQSPHAIPPLCSLAPKEARQRGLFAARHKRSGSALPLPEERGTPPFPSPPYFLCKKSVKRCTVALHCQPLSQPGDEVCDENGSRGRWNGVDSTGRTDCGEGGPEHQTCASSLIHRRAETSTGQGDK